jgi:hypothetical protein
MTEREVALLAYRHQKTPWVPSTVASQDVCIPSAVKAGSRNYGYSVDWLGVKYVHHENQPSSMPIEDDPVIKDMEHWRDYIQFPNLDEIDWEKCAARDTASWDRENRLNSLILINGLFESLHMCCGMEEALCNLLLYPDEVRDFMEAMADHKIQVIQYCKKYYDNDKIQFHDDYGNARSLFMSIDTWRDLIKPSLKRVVDATHELGVIYEHHSCGYIVPLLDDFVELGIDGWNPVQFFNNPVELQKKYHDKLCLVGGFNDAITNNPDSTDEEIKKELERGLQAMSEGGGWMAAPPFIAPYGYRNRIWLDTLDAYNEPKMEELGAKPPKHNYEKLCNTLFRKYAED